MGARKPVAGYLVISLTKCMVATSDAVVRKAGPVLGFGTRAITFISLVMVRLKDLLYDLAYFLHAETAPS